MDYAEQLKKDLSTYRTVKIFARELYRTLFENNNSFPRTKPYSAVMSLPKDQKQRFFDVYLYFLSTGSVPLEGLERRLVVSPDSLKSIKKRTRNHAFLNGIDLGMNPYFVGTMMSEDDDPLDDGNDEEDEKSRSIKR